MPDPLESESGYERFHHRDLACVREPWAERHLLAQHLAWKVFHREPDRILCDSADGRVVSELDWIPERMRLLEAESRRRKAEATSNAF